MLDIQLLLGGLSTFGDGVITSAGMYGLARQLREISSKVRVTTWNWVDWDKAGRALTADLPAKKIVIGYSGGGSRATWLANKYQETIIDLMVLYDPSPIWQMQPIHSNVKHAICYHNRTPLMFGLGGGLLTGPNVVTVNIAEQHLLVQADQTLHNRTLAEVSKLLKGT
jgi:hypothetical protein